jgi:hypothetical protein
VSEDGLVVEDTCPLSPDFELEATVLKVTAKDVRQLYFVFDTDMVHMLEAAATDWTGETRGEAENYASKLRMRASPRTKKSAKKKAKGDGVQLSPAEDRATQFQSAVQVQIRSIVLYAQSAGAPTDMHASPPLPRLLMRVVRERSWASWRPARTGATAQRPRTKPSATAAPR